MSCLVFVCPSCIQPHHWHQILNCSNEAWTSKVEQIILSLICHSRVSIIKMQGQFSCYLLWDTNNFILLKTIFYILLVYYVLFVYTLCPQKKLYSLFFSNISASTWPNSKSKVSFENYRFWEFQNCPYFWNLAK